jgi:hypothetical protein
MVNTRRTFLKTSTAAALTATIAPAADKYVTPPDWFDKPMRWAQLVFTEDDPGQYDPRFWLDYFERTHSGGACLGGGGYMAFYPTRIPLHRRSRFLGNTDPFGELVIGCRKLGMQVIARTDPHAAHQDLYDAHPDWIAVDAQGNKRRHWANPELWVTCALGPMNFEFMTEVTKEIVQLYGVDGVFSNRWAGHGQCFCEHCQRNFKQSSGFDLPRSNNPQDPARKAYILWHEQRLFEVWRLWDSEIRKINPNARFIANSGGGAMSELDMKTVGDLSDILFADRQARRGVMPPWGNGKNGKEYRAGMGRKPIGGIFSVGVEEPYRWKDSVQDGTEIRMWAIDGIANGLRPWFAKFNAKPYDKRWLQPVQDVYQWHFENEKYLRNEENLARVAVVFSQQTAKFYGGEQGRAKVEDPIDGFYQALIESRIPFEMVHDRKLALSEISRYDLLILPNIAALSDAQCEQLRNYVRRGGSLIATHETSLYDEWGVRRKDFGLADLFGATFEGKVETRLQNSYINLNPPHPLLRGLEDTSRIINGTARVHTRASREGVTAPMTLVPSYPDLPMEDVYPRVPRTNTPAVHISGQVIYFPWDIDRTFWEVLAKDHLVLLRNAVELGTRGKAPVTVTGHGILDITFWRQRGSFTVHLVNLTNPMMMKGPLREIYPVGLQKVRVQLPVKPKSIHLCVARKQVPFRTDGSYIEFEVPSIDLHEMVAIDV